MVEKTGGVDCGPLGYKAEGELMVLTSQNGLMHE